MAAVDQRDIYDSMTMQSDSETYDQPDMSSPSSPSSDSASPLILYSPPTFWGLVRGAAINLLLPFVNGLMLGFGELFANELAFRFGWSNTKVRLPASIRTKTETDLGTGVSQPQTSRTRRRDVNRSCREEETQRPGVERLHEHGVGWRIERNTHDIRRYMPEVCIAAWSRVGVGWSFRLSCHFNVSFDQVRLGSFRNQACQYVINRCTSSRYICLGILCELVRMSILSNLGRGVWHVRHDCFQHVDDRLNDVTTENNSSCKKSRNKFRSMRAEPPARSRRASVTASSRKFLLRRLSRNL
jgi:hypothetical protein